MTFFDAALGIKMLAHLVRGDMINIIIANKNLAKTESVAKAALAAYWPYFQGVGMKGG